MTSAATAATASEWNPVRTHVALGPEASRLVVGFRATSGNAVIKVIKIRARTQSVKIAQAKTSAGDVAGLVRRAHLGMAGSRQLTPSTHVVYLQKTLYGADVKTALDQLRADPAVEFAEVDQRRYPMSAPNDPLFAAPTDVATTDSSGRSGQWYMQTPNSATVIAGTATEDLSATDAVSAWAMTTGSSGTVIADVDTGVRFDHPDLLRAGFGGRLLPGYDFVGEDFNRTNGNATGTFLIANDGDGWDPDPSDPGDWINSTDEQNALFPVADCPVEDSSWHGTRVMGVLGAITNNNAGVAGMTWNPYILPVRALGKCGGYDSDIIAGMQWAVGLTVNNPDGSAVPDNPYPADIVNLSLGGSGACPSDYQSALDTLNTMGVLVVASAGNQSGAVGAPGNCSHVLTVAGLRNVGTKVGYSSFGPEVGIAAPAGNCVNSSGACLRSIDTTYNTGLTVPADNSYTNETAVNLGTSFSAPIVSGIAALMRAANANLTPAQLIARIESSATAFPPNTGNLPVCPTVDSTSGECSCVPGQCGAGMVNALSAVTAALNPISAIKTDAVNTFDAGASVAACNQTLASYAWTASGGVTIVGSAAASKVTVTTTGAGTLSLTVTDAAGHADNSASVSFSAAGVATVNAPSSVGTAATACPTPMTVTPVPPTVTEAFSPASVSTNTAATLTITFKNTNGFALTQSSFTQALPASLSVETSPAPTTDCPGASGTLTNSTSSVTLAGANIPASGSCTITLSVKSATAGTYTTTVAANALTTAPAGNNAATASASLTVSAPAPSKSGGGAINWYDLLFAAGVLIAGRRHASRPRISAS
jgi:serine protease